MQLNYQAAAPVIQGNAAFLHSFFQHCQRAEDRQEGLGEGHTSAQHCASTNWLSCPVALGSGPSWAQHCHTRKGPLTHADICTLPGLHLCSYPGLECLQKTSVSFKDQPESHLLPAGSWQIQLPSPYGPLPPWMSLLGQALRSAPDCSSIHLSSCRHLLCAPEQTALPRGVPGGSALPLLRDPPHLHQDLTAQLVLPRGGSLVLLEEEGGKEEAGVGRAGGVHGPEGELGPGKVGRKMWSPAVLGPALKPAFAQALAPKASVPPSPAEARPFLSVTRGVLHEAFPESRVGLSPAISTARARPSLQHPRRLPNHPHPPPGI